MNIKVFVRKGGFPARLIAIFGIAVFIGIDRLTKALVTANMKLYETIPLIKAGETEILNFTHTRNTGAAFSIFQGQRLFLILLPGLIIIGILIFLLSDRLKSKLMITALTLITAGGTGNLIDRVFYGYVVDFIDFRIIKFAVFNFADICVVTGVFIALFATFREEFMNKKNNDE
jgi:signal peptidase II